MALREWKTPVNRRPAPSEVVGEAFVVSGGFGVLAEAPADPTNPSYPISVSVNGSPRVRVTSSPGPGQFRILTQWVRDSRGAPTLEHLGVLQFHSSDEGQSGAATYWRTGSIVSAQLMDLITWFLSPLTGIDSGSELVSLYPPTMDQTRRGRPGDVAFAGGAVYYSDGSTWRQLGGVETNTWSGAVALAAQYGISPSSSFVAAWTAANAYAASLGMSSTSGYVAAPITGASTIAAALGIGSVSSFTAAWSKAQSLGASLGVSSLSAYDAGLAPAPTLTSVTTASTTTSSPFSHASTKAAGDLLLLTIGVANAASTTPTISVSTAGWSLLGTVQYATGTIRGRADVWANRCASASDTAPSITFSPTGTNSHAVARIIRIATGTWNDTGTLSDAWEDVTTASSVSASVNLTGLATTGTNRLCVAHLFQADNVATGLTNNGSYSTQGTDSDSSTGCDGYLGTRSKVVANAGAAGATFSFTSGGTSAPCLGIAFAIRPSGG